MRFFRLVLIIPFLLLGHPGAVAQTPTNPPNQSESAQRLGLTSAQIEKLEAIRNASREKLNQLDQDLMRADQELEALLNSANASEEQIREKHRQVEALRQQLSSVTFEGRLAMRTILTPAQRVAFEKELQRLGELYRQRLGAEPKP